MTPARILTAITTFDAYSYVDLGLSCLKKSGADLIVLDDGSRSRKLCKVCDRHRVYLAGSFRNRLHRSGEGDLLLTLEALRYAEYHKYDYLLKVSRRWICLGNPFPSLQTLIAESGGATFSSFTTAYDYGFRTEFFCCHIPSWRTAYGKIEQKIDSSGDCFVESFLHGIARDVEPDSGRYQEWKKFHPMRQDRSGYVHWEYMGDDRAHVPPYMLWHDTHNPLRYLEASREFGLNYNLSDFEI